MPDLSTPGARVTAIPPSLAARVGQAVRYVISGVTPTTWFGPMQPLAPMAPEGTGGRAFDYPVGYNLQYTPRSYEPVKFSDLHNLADNCDLLRIVIETRKDQVEGQEWEVRPRRLPDGTHPKASQFATQIKEAKEFFAYPDKSRDLASWVREAADEMFVTDALSLYARPDRKGRIYGFDLVQGDTIAPRIDANGRAPAPPDVAYQQILHGVPAADFSSAQLIYFPRNRRPGHVYGYSPVEQIVVTTNTWIRRALHQLSFYTDGNIADAYFTSPQNWQTEQIKAFQEYFDSLFEGNLQRRRHGTWVPNGFDIKQPKAIALQDKFDEQLARIICFAFSISPQPFVSMMNRATAETAHDAAIEEGLIPILNYFRRLFRELFNRLNWLDIEMVPVDDREQDPKTSDDIDVADVKAGIRTINEIRAGRGLDPIPGGDLPMVQTATGYIPITANIEAQEGATAKPNEKPGEQPGAEKLAQLSKAGHHGKVTRKLGALPQGQVAKAAKESVAKRFAKALGKTGKSVAKQVRAALKKTEEDPNKRAQEIAAAIELDELVDITGDTADDLAAVIASAGQTQLIRLGLGGDDMFGVVNQKAVKAASKQAAELISQIDESTREALRGLIADGLAAGNTIDEIANAVGKMTVNGNQAFGADRAQLIANTEVADANSQGALEGAKVARDNGVALKKFWLPGADPCEEICQPNVDQGSIDLDDDFDSGDDAPPGHPRCECALGFETEEDAGTSEMQDAA